MSAPNIEEILTLMRIEYPQMIYGILEGDEVKNHWFKTEDAAPLNKGKKNSIVFCNYVGEKAIEAIQKSKATYIVCHYGSVADMAQPQQDKFYIWTENPRLFYLRILKHFNWTFRDVDRVNIHTNSDIDDTVKVHGDVTIGPDCDIDPYVVIGGDGFGYERNERGMFEKFPHLGGVRIESNVDIGAHTAIDRATLPGEYTYIKDGVKIDNFVHVAHNVEVGEHTLIVSHCNLGGSVKIGRQCWLGMSATILNGVKIGNRCIIGNRANIRKDVSDDSVVIGDDYHLGKVDDKESWKRLVGPPLQTFEVIESLSDY